MPTRNRVDASLGLRTGDARCDTPKHLKRVRPICARFRNRQTQIHVCGTKRTNGIRGHADDDVLLASNR